jgi:hypothetical protein
MLRLVRPSQVAILFPRYASDHECLEGPAHIGKATVSMGQSILPVIFIEVYGHKTPNAHRLVISGFPRLSLKSQVRLYLRLSL